MKVNFQPGKHPDADQLSVFVEGAATAREQERMLTHLAECADCRKAVFLMQPREEKPATSSAPARGWIGRRLLPVGLPAAALACGLIAVLIYVRPRGGSPEVLQETANVRQPERQVHETTAPPAPDSARLAPSKEPKKSFGRNAAAPNLSRQANPAVAGSNLPISNGQHEAANVAAPKAAAPATAPLAQSGVGGGVAGGFGIGSGQGGGIGGGVYRAQASHAAAQNSVAKKKDLPPLEVARASGQETALAGISGHITDRSGAMVAGATVTLRDANGETRQTATAPDGSFHLTELPPGQYELIAKAKGFATKNQAIELRPSELAMLQPVLDVGKVSETVEVSGAAPTAQTETATVTGRAVAETSVGLAAALPSGLPIAATISHGKRFISLDSAGNLFLSRNAGKKWKKIKPQWSGKAIRIELTPASSNQVPPQPRDETSPPSNPMSVFQLTTDADSVWTSKDGVHWHQQ